jgi:hypothetical protein
MPRSDILKADSEPSDLIDGPIQSQQYRSRLPKQKLFLTQGKQNKKKNKERYGIESGP